MRKYSYNILTLFLQKFTLYKTAYTLVYNERQVQE